jgi:exopolyphosphatase / guanosine-5'-triphosphate,3'-diphosphate pyrophosphatase
VQQTAYYFVIIALGSANVVLAAVAYAQRARQLAGRRLHETQLALAEERNRMAAGRAERLDQQVELLTAIRDLLPTGPVPNRGVRSSARRVVGVIDVGSATVRLVVAASDGRGEPRRIGRQRSFLHLGAEAERDGRYAEGTLRDVATTVAAFEQHARHLGADDLAIVLTAPGRIGANSAELVEAIEQATGASVSALSPEQEAQLCFLGASSLASDPAKRLAVCDVGGGSTEVAIGTAGSGVEQTFCFETGALSLTQRHLSASPTRQELKAARSAAEELIVFDRQPSCDLLLASGGSARAVAKLVGHVVDRDVLERALELAVDPPKRVVKRVPAARRRSLAAGVVLLSVLQSRLDLPMTISPAGLRDGVIERLLREEPKIGAPRDGRTSAVA